VVVAVAGVQRWERCGEIPLLLLAAGFLLAYARPVVQPGIDSDLRLTLHVVSWTVCGAFAAGVTHRRLPARAPTGR
jgi:voltage-gated potassium channel